MKYEKYLLGRGVGEYSIHFFSPWQTLHQCYFFPSCAPPTPLCILYFISIHFLFFFPGKLSSTVILFLNLSQPNPNIFLPVLGWEGFTWLPQDTFYSVSSPLLNLNFVIFYIHFLFFSLENFPLRLFYFWTYHNQIPIYSYQFWGERVLHGYLRINFIQFFHLF